jgi:hypothetical protein
MAMHDLGSLQSGNPDGVVVSLELDKPDAAPSTVPDKIGDIAQNLSQADRDQLARDIADIERATAALRRAEPALESWTNPATAITTHKPGPLWLIIGVLWLSTAIVAASVAFVIATLAG